MQDPHHYYIIYKPYRMVSQFISNDHQQRRKRFLGELTTFPEGSMAVGRLDEKSEGLLLITTNGKWSDQINRSDSVDKEYYVQVDGTIDEIAIESLRNGVFIGINGRKYKTKECEVELLEQIPDLPATVQKIRDDRHGPTSWLRIILHEGKFRQIRKMTSAVGFPTLRLARIRIGDFKLDQLNNESCMKLSQKDIEKYFTL